jgi:hypothetical protein
VSADTLARWGAFEQKIQQRFQEVMQEAEAGFKDLIASDPTDAITFGNAESAINARVEGLLQKLHETFSSQVTMALAGGPDLDRAIAQMESNATGMRLAWKRLALRLKTDLYRAMYTRVAVEMQNPVPCTGCGSPLAKATPHRVEAITCRACRAIVQAAPAPVVSTYFLSAGHVFAEAATLEKRAAIDVQRQRAHAGRKARGYTDEPLESLQEWERMELDYWRTYFETAAQILPSTPKEIDEWVASRMQPFYESLERSNDVWRRARGLPTRG